MTKQIFYFISFFCLLISCKKTENNSKEIAGFDRLNIDSIYTVDKIALHFPDRVEEIEMYIKNKKDTISNQYKLIKNNKIDTIESVYYDLNISKTNQPHIYKGRITLHTKYENLKLNKHNRRTLEFSYCEQNKDSMFISSVKSTVSTTLDFTFENYYGKNLQGLLYQIVERDTTKGLINLNQVHLLVDNSAKSDNLFLESYDLHKDKNRKINLKGVKLNKMK